MNASELGTAALRYLGSAIAAVVVAILLIPFAGAIGIRLTPQLFASHEAMAIALVFVAIGTLAVFRLAALAPRYVAFNLASHATYGKYDDPPSLLQDLKRAKDEVEQIKWRIERSLAIPEVQSKIAADVRRIASDLEIVDGLLSRLRDRSLDGDLSLLVMESQQILSTVRKRLEVLQIEMKIKLSGLW